MMEMKSVIIVSYTLLMLYIFLPNTYEIIILKES